MIGFFALELMVVITTTPNDLSIAPYIEIAISLIGCGMVFVIIYMIRDRYIIDARVREGLRRDFLAQKMTTVLEDRYTTVVSAANTLMMYQLLEEKLKEARLM